MERCRLCERAGAAGIETLTERTKPEPCRDTAADGQSALVCQAGLLPKGLLDQLQEKPGGKQPIDLIQATCKGHHNENQNPFMASVRAANNGS